MRVSKFIKRGIKAILPHGIVVAYGRYCKKRKPTNVTAASMFTSRFWPSYLNYIQHPEMRVTLMEKCPFMSVVSVQGFGYSGSGAVLDLLREYNCNVVIADIDNEGSVAKRPAIGSYEVMFMVAAGGLLEIERYLDSNNVASNDALLHRFILLVEKSELYQQVPEVRPYFYEFLSQIMEMCIPQSSRQYFSLHLNFEDNNCMLFLKKMPIVEYRKICRKLLYSIFAKYKESLYGDILVLDQFLSDFEFDTKRNLEYLPELKTIYVYRNLKDVFTFANLCHEEWLPSDINLFVDWCKIKYKNFNPERMDGSLVVKFEELITNYNKIVSDIEAYLGIVPSCHTMQYTALDPKESSKNIGLWKHHPEYTDAYAFIEKDLKRLC